MIHTHMHAHTKTKLTGRGREPETESQTQRKGHEPNGDMKGTKRPRDENVHVLCSIFPKRWHERTHAHTPAPSRR